MGKYNKTISENPKVEMIHVSLDRSEDAAVAWAKDAKFPWLTILPDDVEKSKIRQFMTSNYVPFYVLLDADGKEVETGAKAFDKAESLK